MSWTPSAPEICPAAPESQDGTAAEQRPEPEAAVTLDLPGLLADHLHHTGDAAVREAPPWSPSTRPRSSSAPPSPATALPRR
ncbi:hypothetical protein ABT187_39525 [Streptomyces sp. NPDC001817]|uniref:hypothetical protein n=1 Tax=Streptomyces sp. NPDC001817 TaxID=3154398 RepID=UPI00332E5665